NKLGGNTLVLAGNASHTGGTTISGGTLQVGNGANSGSLSGNVANEGVLAFNRSDDAQFDGNISGGGSLNKLGGNTLALLGNATHTGGTTVSAGTLSVGNGGTTGSIAGDVNVNAGATLAFNRSDKLAFTGNVSGDGALAYNGAGKLI